MQEFQEKRKFRKMIFSSVAIGILVVLLVVLSVATAKVFLKSRIAVEKNNRIKQELAELEKRKLELENEIVHLQTESGEDEAVRDKFNVRKPGEEVVIIVDNNIDSSAEDAGKNEKGLFFRAWESVKKIF